MMSEMSEYCKNCGKISLTALVSLPPLSPSTATSPRPRNTRTQTRTTAATSISPTNTGTARTCAECHYSVLTVSCYLSIAYVDCEPLTSAVNIVLVIVAVQQLGDVGEVFIVGDQDGRPWQCRGLFCHSLITTTAHLLTSVGVCVLQDEAGALDVGLVRVLVPHHRHSVLTALASTIVHKRGSAAAILKFHCEHNNCDISISSVTGVAAAVICWPDWAQRQRTSRLELEKVSFLLLGDPGQLTHDSRSASAHCSLLNTEY